MASGSVLADVFSREWKEGQMAGALDGDGQPALVLGARSGLAPAPDLAAVCEEAAQRRDILVVDDLGLFKTECADFAPSLEASSTVGPPLLAPWSWT
jgi:hypothetical protein